MKRWLVGFVPMLYGCWAAQALAQAPKPTPTAAFPSSDAPPATAAAPPATAAAPPAPPAAAAAPLAPGPAPATTAAPATATAPQATAEEPLPAPPAAQAPRASATAPNYAEPPLPPPRDLDLRPIRLRRPSFIGGELGWNGMCGLCVAYSYHFIPQVAFDMGLGLSLTGWRIGGRVRANFLTSEWTPFVAVGGAYAGGVGGEGIEVTSRGEKAKLEVLPSPFLQLAAGANYTGTEGFVFTATGGYSIPFKPDNTRFLSGSRDVYDDTKGLFQGGLILAVAFGYAF